MSGGLCSVVRNNLDNIRQRGTRQSQSVALAGRKRGRLKAVARRIQRRIGTLNQAGPDRDGWIAVVLPLPGERLRVGQSSDYQERSLLRHSAFPFQIDG